jgi:hypothetical protein
MQPRCGSRPGSKDLFWDKWSGIPPCSVKYLWFKELALLLPWGRFEYAVCSVLGDLVCRVAFSCRCFGLGVAHAPGPVLAGLVPEFTTFGAVVGDIRYQ